MKSELWQEVECVRRLGGLGVAAQLSAKTVTEARCSSEISVPAPVPLSVHTHTHKQAPGAGASPGPLQEEDVCMSACKVWERNVG